MENRPLSTGSDNLFLSNHWRETAIPRGGAREPRKNSSSSTLPGGGLASPAYISPELTELATLWYLWYDSEGHELFCGFDNEASGGPSFVPIESLNLIDSIRTTASQTNTPNAHNTTPLSVEEKFVCPTCGKEFQRRERLEAHGNVHRNERPYVCDASCGDINCQNTYSSRANLARHCHPVDNRYKKCTVCGAFILCQNIARHLKTCNV